MEAISRRNSLEQLTITRLDENSVWPNDKDLAAFIQLYDREFYPTISSQRDIPEYVQRLMKLADIHVAADQANCALEGMIACYNNDHSTRRAYIPYIAVGSRFRGRGIGRSLLEAALELSKFRGMRAVAVRTSQDNRGAVQLYKTLGFKPEGGAPSAPDKLDLVLHLAE